MSPNSKRSSVVPSELTDNVLGSQDRDRIETGKPPLFGASPLGCNYFAAIPSKPRIKRTFHLIGTSVNPLPQQFLASSPCASVCRGDHREKLMLIVKQAPCQNSYVIS